MRLSLLLAVSLSVVVVPAVAQAGFRVSSFSSSRGSNEFGAAAALDSDPASAWRTAADADMVGSWFEIDVAGGEIDKLGMIVGWDRDEDVFFDYGRVQTVKVEVFDDASETPREPVLVHSVTFQDQRGWQVVDVPNVTVGDELVGGRVRLTVMEAVPGKDYPNLAVSEVLVHLTEHDAPVVTLKTPPSSANDDHFPDNLVDGNPRTYWSAGPAGAGDRFTVEASGYGVSAIGLTPGPRTHKRPKTLVLRANNARVTWELPEDARGVQWTTVPPLTGYTGSGFGEVDVQVTETWPGSTTDELAISEVQLRYTTHEGL